MAIINRLEKRTYLKHSNIKTSDKSFSLYEVIEKITSELVKNQRELITEISLGRIPEIALENEILKIIGRYNYGIVNSNGSKMSRDEMIKAVLDYVFRYGPIQKILDIEECSGIFINSPDNVWAKIGSDMIKTNISFGSNENITSYIYTIKAKLKGEINENTPLSKFEDSKSKLRIICCIAPMAHISPTVVIRKHSEKGFNMNDLMMMGMLTHGLASELIQFNNAGANIIVCGKGGAGKTTLIRALIEELPHEERILIMEEQPEIFSQHPNAVQLIVKRNENGKVINLLDISEKGLLMVMMKMSGTNLSDGILFDMLYSSTNIIVYVDNFVVCEVVEVVNSSSGVEYNELWRFNIEKRHSTFIEGEHVKVNSIRSDEMIDMLRVKGVEYEKVREN